MLFTLKCKVLSFILNRHLKKFESLFNHQEIMITQNKRLAGIVLAVVVLLFIPLVAMQFTHEVNWSIFDFAVAGVLLLGTGLLCELVLRKVSIRKNQILLCMIILAVLLLVWAELAVGIFGSPIAGS